MGFSKAPVKIASPSPMFPPVMGLFPPMFPPVMGLFPPMFPPIMGLFPPMFPPIMGLFPLMVPPVMGPPRRPTTTPVVIGRRHCACFRL